MHPSTVTSATFRLLDPLGTPVAGGAARRRRRRACRPRSNPTAPLAADTLYTVQVTSGVQDLAGTAAHSVHEPLPHRAASGAGEHAAAGRVRADASSVRGGGAPRRVESVAALGDLDGDGIKDFISGAPGYQRRAACSWRAGVEAGAALVYLGSARRPQRATEPDIIFTGGRRARPRGRVGRRRLRLQRRRHTRHRDRRRAGRPRDESRAARRRPARARST